MIWFMVLCWTVNSNTECKNIQMDDYNQCLDLGTSLNNFADLKGIQVAIECRSTEYET